MANYAIDPHNSWLALRERAAAESDPRRRALITEVADHMEAEITGQLEPLMATLTAQPVYHFRGHMPQMKLSGHEAVSGFYSGMFEGHGQQFEVVIDRIIADTDFVVTEGQVKQVYPGEALLAMGVAEVDGQPVSNDDLFVSNAQLVTVWPADADGKLIGEDIYFGEDPMQTLTRITREQLPPYHYLAAQAA